jgi:hypothetical protein
MDLIEPVRPGTGQESRNRKKIARLPQDQNPRQSRQSAQRERYMEKIGKQEVLLGDFFLLRGRTRIAHRSPAR